MLSKIRANRQFSSGLKRFASVHDFVPFGKITSEDNIERIRGVTFAREAADDNYMHGNINGYEVTFLTRSSSHGNQQLGVTTYDWTVISVELQAHNLPHIIFDNKKHDRRFYSSVFTKHPKLRLANAALKILNPSAELSFDVYMAPETTYALTHSFSDEILQRMTYYYGKYDVEVDTNRLYVFARGDHFSFQQLQDMLNEALWLAERLEMRSTYQAEEQPEGLHLVTA